MIDRRDKEKLSALLKRLPVVGLKAMGRAGPPGGADALRHGNRWTTTGDMLGGSTV